jgi:hypothetical protein
MPHFSREEIEEIARRLAVLGKRDSEFDSTDFILSDDYLAIVQNGDNRKITAADFFSGMPNVYNLSGYVDGRISGAMSDDGIIGSALSEYVKSRGGTFSGTINFEGRTDFFEDIYSHYNIVFDTGQAIEMDEGRITGLLSPVSNTEAANKEYVDQQIEESTNDRFVPKTGGEFIGPVNFSGGAHFITDVDMGNNRLTNVGTPIANADAANKQYVDESLTWQE